MKVLTLNAWGAYGPPERRPVLREAILKLDADLLLLQEANVPGLLESLPYPARLHFPEAGLAILSRFPILNGRQVRYRTLSTLEPHLIRGALIAEMVAGSTRFHAVSTHLAWKADDSAARLAQAEELLELAAALPDPVLIGGDLNAPPTDPPAQQVIAAGFSDLYAKLHPGITPPPASGPKGLLSSKDPTSSDEAGSGVTWDNRNPFIQSHSVQFPDRRIDYLFLRDRSSVFTPSRCEVACRTPVAEGLYPSDHYGVLADFNQC